MKSFSVRIPDAIAADIESEAKRRGLSKSDIVRERLERTRPSIEIPPALADIADLIGSVDELQVDLSARKKHYLRSTGYGRKRHR